MSLSYITLFFILFIGLIILIAVFNLSSSPSVIVSQPAASTPASSAIKLCNTCSLATPTYTLQGGAAGTKRALLIGCNYDYPGSPAIALGCTLSGCIQDIKNIQGLLLSKGYSDITVLVDDGTAVFPSKNTIISSLTSAVQSTQAGDMLFVWFSGHGAQIANPSADGGYNETWCPPDTIGSGNYIRDSQIQSILATAPANSTIFVGSDSCHSATVLDLQYILVDPSGSSTNRTLDLVRGKAVPPLHDVQPKSTFQATTRTKRTTQTMNVVFDTFYSSVPALIIGLSGCQDYTTSADTFENGMPQGAMTWAFLNVFSPRLSLSGLLSSMRNSLKENNYRQIPQLTMSKSLDPNTATLSSILQLN